MTARDNLFKEKFLSASVLRFRLESFFCLFVNTAVKLILELYVCSFLFIQPQGFLYSTILSFLK